MKNTPIIQKNKVKFKIQRARSCVGCPLLTVTLQINLVFLLIITCNRGFKQKLDCRGVSALSQQTS